MKNLDIALNGKLTQLRTILTESPQTFISAAQSQTYSTDDIITKMRDTISRSPMSQTDKNRALSILTRHSSTSSIVSVDQVLHEFSIIIINCKSLVHDVLPMIVNWSDQ